MPELWSPRLRRIGGGLFAAAALLFLAVFVVRNTAELRAHEWNVRPALLVASLLINMLSLVCGVVLWQMLLRRLGITVGLQALARVWFLSGLGRYIPGKVWQFVGAAHIGASANMPAAITIASLAAHTGVFVVGALLVAAYILPPDLTTLVGVPTVVLHGLAPVLLVLVHPAVIRAGLSVIRRTSGRTIAEWNASWTDGILLVLLSAICWGISGLAFYLFVLSITPVPASSIPAIVGIQALAFVAGYIVFVAPAGLGVKEGALTVMLSLYIPAPVAAVVAVGARLWSVCAEVLPALILLRVPPAGPSTPLSEPRSP